MRSAITVAGILGVAINSRRISGSTASTIDPTLSRRYAGASERSAARTVFLATPTWRAISLIDRPSDLFSRRISGPVLHLQHTRGDVSYRELNMKFGPMS